MDTSGNFEWANNGFTRIYGLDYQEFKERVGSSIFAVSTNQNVKNAVEICRNKKESVIYESYLTNNSTGERTWLQTTLTPILDQKKDIIKLIAVETDISKLKNAEEEIACQRDMLKFQNQQITDSIEYAKTIQTAMLPDLSVIGNLFNVFVIYRPKDIVSGDFYWHSQIKADDKLYNYFAVVDCTGHGVPGAFMSMIGNRLLNEIINEKRTLNPADILEKLDNEIEKSLRKKQAAVDDGMDLVICRIEKTDNQANVVFAGAKRPLFYFSTENNSLELIKGSKRAIGGIYSCNSDKPFEEHNLTLQKGDNLYLITDGYTDQNSPNRKRLGRKRFQETLENIAYLPANDQKKYLENLVEQWQSNAQQRDDITLLGIQI